MSAAQLKKSAHNEIPVSQDSNYLMIFMSAVFNTLAMKDNLGNVTPITAAFVPVITKLIDTNNNITGCADDIYIIDASNPFTMTLTDATLAVKPIEVKKAGSANITILGFSGQTFDGNASAQLRNKNAIKLVPKDGTWHVL